MPRSSNSELTKRINKAIVLLGEYPFTGQVASALKKRFGVSSRQAYRYIQQAQKVTDILPIPEQKVVFTVKVPEGLVHRLRVAANSEGKSLSHLVTTALEVFLKKESYGEK